MSTAIHYIYPAMNDRDGPSSSGSHVSRAATPAFQHGYPTSHTMYYPASAAQMSYPPPAAYLPTPSGTPVLVYNDASCLPQQVPTPWQYAMQPQAQVISQEDHHRAQHFDPQIRVPSDLGASVFYPDQTANPIVVAPPAVPAPQVVIVPSQTLPVTCGYTYAAPVYVQDAYPSQTSVNVAAATTALTPPMTARANLCAAPGDVFGSTKEQPTFAPAPVECSSVSMEASGSSGSFHGVIMASPCSSPALVSQIGNPTHLTVPNNSNFAPYSPALSTVSAAGGMETTRAHKLKRSRSDADMPRPAKRKVSEPVPLLSHPGDGGHDDDDDDEADEDEHDHSVELAARPDAGADIAVDGTDDKPKKRSRTAQACERCRIRKARCFGGQPCNRCTKRKFVCEFAPTKAAIARTQDHPSSTEPPTADSASASPTLATALPTVPLLKRKPGRPSLEGVAAAAAAGSGRAHGLSNSCVSVLSQVRGAASTQVSPVQSRAPRPTLAARPRSHSSTAVPQSAGPLFALTTAATNGPVLFGSVPLASDSPAALFGHGLNGFVSPAGLSIGLGLELPSSLPASGGLYRTQPGHPGDLTLTTAPKDELELEDDLSLPGLASGSCSSSISPFSGSNTAELVAHNAMTGPLSSSSLASSAWTALLDPAADGAEIGHNDNVFAFTAGYDACGPQTQLGSSYPLEPMYQDALDQLQGDSSSLYTLHLRASPQLSF